MCVPVYSSVPVQFFGSPDTGFWGAVLRTDTGVFFFGAHSPRRALRGMLQARACREIVSGCLFDGGGGRVH